MKKIGMVVISILCCIGLTIMPIFADVAPDTNAITQSVTQIPSGDNNLRFIVNGSVGNWVCVLADVEYDRAYSYTQAKITSWNYTAHLSTNQELGVGNPTYGNGGTLSSSLSTKGNYIFARQFVLRIQLVNNYSHAITINNYYKLFQLTGLSDNSFFGFDHIQNNHDIAIYPYSSDQFYCYFNELKNFYPSGAYVMEANSLQDCIITFTQYQLSTSSTPPSSDTISISVNASGMSSYSASSQYDGLVTDMYTADILLSNRSISSNVQNIADAYTSNSSNVSNTQSNINSTASEEAQLHQAEVNYYLQNEQALQNVGISNFSFDPDQSSGLGAVVSDFTDLWNNIGPLQIIFTFTLSMSLATYLLRHKPITGAIKQNERKK